MTGEMATELGDAHELQLQSFLRFSNLKRQQHQREILQCIDEAQEKVLPGEMYSSAEVKSFLNELRQEMRQYITKEVDSAYHSSALLVKLQLVQAQQAGISISVDTALLESELLLQQIRACETAALSRPASDFTVKRGALAQLAGGAVKVVPDSGATLQRDQLQAEVVALRSRLEALQAVANASRVEQAEAARKLQLTQEQVAAKDAEVAQARSAITQLEKDAAVSAVDLAVTGNTADRAAASAAEAAMKSAQATAAAAAHQLAAVQQQLKEAAAEVAALRALLDSKLQDSKQWQQLRNLMQNKSQEVLSLRKQLAKYEPRATAVPR